MMRFFKVLLHSVSALFSFLYDELLGWLPEQEEADASLSLVSRG